MLTLPSEFRNTPGIYWVNLWLCENDIEIENMTMYYLIDTLMLQLESLSLWWLKSVTIGS